MLTATYLVPLLLLGAAPEMAPPAAPSPSPAMAAAPKAAPANAMKAMDAPKAERGMWKPYDYKKASRESRKKQTSSGSLVVLAYVLILGVVLGYVLLLARRQAKLRREVDELRQRLGAKPPAAKETARGSGSEGA